MRATIAAFMLFLSALSLPAVAEITIQTASPMALAIERGQTDTVKGMLLRGESPNGIDSRGESYLINAVTNGRDDIVDLLLKAKAHTELTDRFGNTALIRAAERGDAEIARLLLRHRAKADAANKQGTTALMVAARRGAVDMIQALIIDGKADVNRADYTGRRALAYARQSTNPAAATAIIQAGGKE